MYDILQLNDMLVAELKELAKSLGLKGINRLAKQDLIYKILDEQAVKGGGLKKDLEQKESKNKEENQTEKAKKRKSPRVQKRKKIEKKQEDKPADDFNNTEKVEEKSKVRYNAQGRNC